MNGFLSACERYQNPDFAKNDAMLYAAMRYLMRMKGKQAELLASYEPALTMFGGLVYSLRFPAICLV